MRMLILIRTLAERLFLIQLAFLYTVLNYVQAMDCGKEIHNSSFGTIHSPYPKSQTGIINCVWEIQGNFGNVILIRFNDLDMEEDDMANCTDDAAAISKQNLCCSSNWLKIGVPESEQPLVLCGRNKLIKPYQSTGSIVWVKYHASASSLNTRRGFNLTYSVLRIRVPEIKSCLQNETTCYPNYHYCHPKCDHIMHCTNGADEMGCVKGCNGRVMCDSWNGCYTPDERCNGVAQCGDHSDERNCSPDLCRSDRGGFLCGNRQCIRESWQCDQTNDCGDNSDELNCLKNSVITAAVMGSLICGLLLVIAVGCTCKLYALRFGDSSGSSRSTLALSPLEREMLRREPPPPYSIAVSQAPANFFQQVAAPPHLLDPFHFTRLCRGSHHRRGRRIRRQRRRPPTPPPSCLLVMPLDVANSVGGETGVPTIVSDGGLSQCSTAPESLVYIPPGGISVGFDKLPAQVHGETTNVNVNAQNGEPSVMPYLLSLARPASNTNLNISDQTDAFPIVSCSDSRGDDDDSPLLIAE